jgi:hypothetical protein
VDVLVVLIVLASHALGYQTFMPPSTTTSMPVT